ncbi:MAG: YdcH family protein [Polaromonas sp.]|nr:YdcH family protein [Polaromonas sp.]
MDLNLHSLERRLIELRIEHADINARVDIASHADPLDELMLRRLKNRGLYLRDQIARLELSLDPPEPA